MRLWNLFVNMSTIIFSMLMLFVISCTSNKFASTLMHAENAGLQEVLLQYHGKVGKIKSVELLEYTVDVVSKKQTVERGRIDFPSRLVEKIRTRFTITNLNNLSVDAESLFFYTKEGVLADLQQSAIFYGRTSQVDFPFTISLVADEKTYVFSGKSHRATYVLDIVGDAYIHNELRPRISETGFLILYKNTPLAFVDLAEKPRVFMSTSLEDDDLRKSVLYSMAFLLLYDRVKRFPVNPFLIKGE